MLISFSILVFGTVGGWLGQIMDGGNWLGGWSILLGIVGSFAGVWIGYKAGQHLGV